MRIFSAADAPLKPADTATFAGSARTARIAADEAAVPVGVYRVEFDAGARTHWHRHSGPQWLFVVAGRIRVQTWEGEPRDLHTGDAVVFAPGEKHWHGAAPGTSGAHLAVNVDVTTEWLEPVAD
jgi:quercetin dioxygenase-like cupin family protein